jgi:hypothetical protein
MIFFNLLNICIVTMDWDVTRYAKRLPKDPSKLTANALNQKEASLRWQYPPLEEVTASTSCIIVNRHGIILAWYLPGILSNSRQVCLSSLSDQGRI